MIRIESEPWAAMVAHARQTYPNECCGAMLGSIDDSGKTVFSYAHPLFWAPYTIIGDGGGGK